VRVEGEKETKEKKKKEERGPVASPHAKRSPTGLRK